MMRASGHRARPYFEFDASERLSRAGPRSRRCAAARHRQSPRTVPWQPTAGRTHRTRSAPLMLNAVGAIARAASWSIDLTSATGCIAACSSDLALNRVARSQPARARPNNPRQSRRRLCSAFAIEQLRQRHVHGGALIRARGACRHERCRRSRRSCRAGSSSGTRPGNAMSRSLSASPSGQ